MNIIGVFGNRNITDEKLVLKLFNQHLEKFPYLGEPLILHGGAKGPQKIISDKFRNIVFRPWNLIWPKLKFSSIYFYLRNKQIVENSDEVVIFSNGEREAEVYKMINLCGRLGVPHFIFDVEKENENRD